MSIRNHITRVGLFLGVVALLGACSPSSTQTVNDQGTPSDADAIAVDVSTDVTVDAGPADVPPPPPPTGPYYEIDRVLEVEISMTMADWDSLRYETRTWADILGGDCLDGPPDDVFNWYTATVTVDGTTLSDVGIRKKGFLGSLSEERPSLKIRFDKYVDDQLLDGVLKRVTLNNVQQDGSKLNTCLSYHVFALAGIPTPRCNFARVTVNGDYLGLFVHLESVKTAFLKHNFEDASGNLYEGAISDFRPVFSGSFEKKTNEDENDWSDIEAVIAALELSDDEYLDALKERIDLDQFITFWALEAIIGHWDGYTGDRNNFMIYREPEGKFVFIPWGADSTFHLINNPFNDFQDPQSVMATAAIPNRLYGDENVRPLYVARLKELLDEVWDEEALLARVDEMAAIVQEHALPGYDEWAEGDTDRVRDFIQDRRSLLIVEMTPDPPEWTWPMPEPDLCWEDLGKLDASFETTWDSTEVEEPIQEGSVTISTYSLNGENPSFLQSGSTAGLDDDSSPEDPDDKKRANINIINMTEDFKIQVIVIQVPYLRVNSGSTMALDQKNADAFLIQLSPPAYNAPEFMGRVAHGSVSFDTASTVAGEVISGQINGTFYNFGGYVSGSKTANAPPDESGIVINEIAATGDPLDWVELYNSSDKAVDLSGFVFADDLFVAYKRVPFPGGTTIEPGAYLQLELDKDAWPGFSLGQGEEFGIWNLEGALVDSVDWADGDAPEGASFARVPDATGDFQTVTPPTPGAAND